MRVLSLMLFIGLILFANFSYSQESSFQNLTNFPARFLEKLSKKASTLEEKVISRTEKTLAKLERQEKRLYKKLLKKDSIAAQNLFANSLEKYESLKKGFENSNPLGVRGQYVPYLDTLKTSLNFLSDEADKSLNKLPLTDLKKTSSSIEQLNSKLQYSDQVRSFIKERRQFLKQELGKFGLVKELKKFNKEVYYYSEQIKEYREILSNPEKLERKAITMLQKLPLFQRFMQKHSELAALFPMPDNYGSPVALQGLQTRASVQNVIQQQTQSAGPNAQAMLQQNIQAAQNQLRSWKNKVNELGGMNSDTEIPDFKPNTQKTKSFWKRLEYGTNIQHTRSTTFLPVTSDLGISVGFKLNDKSIAGLGAIYKMGWGKDIRHISISHQGIGFRSFVDWKIKGSFYLSGGYEQNYRNRFDNVQQLRKANEWQSSGLIGASKRYSISKKWKGDMKLLFDFLYKSHSPQTQPVLFRFGYSL